jgi:hypothetical protein
MELTIIGPVLISLVFGLVVAGVEILIAGGSPFPVRQWLSRSWVYACFAYIILFGIIKV